MYADIVLPLPLDGLFTYSVPPALAGQVRPSVRVLVPFGRSKTYVGIVVATHEHRPEGYELKDVLQVIDTQPVLLPEQYRLWSWIADYYMAPIGEVYKVALPPGLKAEEGYRPRTETMLRLAPVWHNDRALGIARSMLARARKQLAALNGFLELAGWSGDEPGAPLVDVSRDELVGSGCATADALQLLVRRGMLETYEVEASRLNHGGEPHPELIKALSPAQQQAYDAVLASLQRRPVTLLHGVTSSGKTELYIHLIQRELERGRQVLYLLPEIALTVQMMERLSRVFGHRLGIYHSKYSDAERVEIWQKQLSAEPYGVILGARSAVFLPFQRLGLVIVDEEHETSYKQQDPAPRYHARSVAIMLARQCAAPVLLGTATPALETYHNAMTGKFGLVELTERYQGVALPRVEVVDTGDLQRRRMMNGPFSPYLIARVRETLEQGRQAILFQNRRGWAPLVECHECGWVPRCPNCDVTLTLHRSQGVLTCHYCGHTSAVPAQCPCCGSRELRSHGYGTEKVEDYVHELFPDARVGRMDLDTTRSRRAYEHIIGDFAAGRTNLLVGTQMVSKGLDFGGVSVVGILNADTLLNQPDFRAYEHAYMMMAQVSGRAGRRGEQGLVVLQTRSPQLPVIQQVVEGNYVALYQSLLAERREFGYPPFTRLVCVYLRHRSDTLTSQAAALMGTLLRQWFGTRVLGPDRPAVARVRSLCIRKLVLKLEHGLSPADVRSALRRAATQLLQDKRYSTVQIYFDVDPL